LSANGEEGNNPLLIIHMKILTINRCVYIIL
jgi:hypothetical protein